jgi:microcystin-dependent protein
MTKYRELFEKHPRTTTGDLIFTSTTSGDVYSTLASIYHGQGEEGLMLLLRDELADYMISSDDYNGINDDIEEGYETLDYKINSCYIGTHIYGTSSTGNDTYVTAFSGTTPTSYNNGMIFNLNVDVANTGAATLNINGLGAKDIKKLTLAGKVALVTGDIVAGGIYTLIFDGTDFIVINPTERGSVAGEIKYFAMNTAPDGYLKANGAAVSRTTYAALFTAIGTTFGVGNGSTTFNLPDLRGVFPRGWADDGSYDSGRSFGSYQADDNKAHTHTGTTDSGGTHTHNVDDLYHGIGGSDPLKDVRYPSSSVNQHPYGQYVTASGGSHTHTFTSNSTGATEVKVKNVALLACIKY